MKKMKKNKTNETDIFQSDIKRIKICFKRVGISKNIRKIFSIGEDVVVEYGSFKSAKVIDIIEDGIYKIDITLIDNTLITKVYGWYEIFKTNINNKCNIPISEDLNINFSSRNIEELMESFVMYFGVDFNPSYQRELVWNLDDEKLLISSVFNRIDIGKFVLLKLPFTDGGLNYEILDGKQRLNTLYRYYIDEFEYDGCYYSDLSFNHKLLFKSTMLSVAVANKSNMTEEKILEYFLRLNTTGKVMSVEHLNKIKSRYENLCKTK